MVALTLLLVSAAAAHDTVGYWQQGVRYAIVARLDEETGVLSGTARIAYVNHSPDTLTEFYVHQFLNAFRPGSRWAEADEREERVRFQRLRDPDYAFSRITRAELMGTPAKPEYPFAPDSTVARFPLPTPLRPGDSLVVEIAWDARPSTLPRRQGRDPRARRYDFAQWYPKVVVYDRYKWNARPLYPAGEFYGEFATYDVTLDLPEDQVVGATGVPVEGDPGWERAKAEPSLAVDYQRDWYRSRLPAPGSPGEPGVGRGCAVLGVAVGRKCVRFYAENVHDFAFSLNPRYVYAEGRYGNVVVRVLYRPQDSVTWGKGIAVARTETALAWLDSLFGPFPWPQLTNVRRIEGGGTEYPMMVMDGSASLGLILHEVGHNYTMGVLANNEWREGWLDEGFTNFQTAWFFERQGGEPAYPELESGMLGLDLAGWSQPISMPSEHFRDFVTYNLMIYSKAQLFYEQLRYVVGDDAMRRILRTFYARWQLKHVGEEAFRRVAEEVSGMDLGWLFGQWLHGTPLIDYRLKGARRERLPDGRWRTTVTIERLGDGWMPVEIGAARGARRYGRASGQADVEEVSFVTPERPGRLMVDPRVHAHDWNMLNNEERGLRWLFSKARTRSSRLDRPFRDRAMRDARVQDFLPVVWYNDFGGATFGLRFRGNYAGMFSRTLTLVTVPGRSEARASPSTWPDLYLRVVNPLTGGAAARARARTELTLSVWSVEGRVGAAVAVDRSLKRHLAFGPDPHVGFSAIWMATHDLSYLDRAFWEDAGTIEAGPWVGTRFARGRSVFTARLGVAGGLVYSRPGPGLATAHRYDVEPFLRSTAVATAELPAPAGTRLRLRVFAGGHVSDTLPPRQRRVPVAGADPYETFTNPLLRSRGALLARPDFFYHASGNANLRGFAPVRAGRWAVSLNAEVVRPLVERTRGFVRSVAVTGFADAGVVDAVAIPSFDGRHDYTTLYDGGLGLVTRHQLGDRGFTLRFEVPLVVNRWDYARDFTPGDARFGFRWQVSLEPTW